MLLFLVLSVIYAVDQTSLVDMPEDVVGEILKFVKYCFRRNLMFFERDFGCRFMCALSEKFGRRVALLGEISVFEVKN